MPTRLKHLPHATRLANFQDPYGRYASILPKVGELCSTYQLEPEVAFFIARPVLLFKEQKAGEAGSSDRLEKSEVNRCAQASLSWR